MKRDEPEFELPCEGSKPVRLHFSRNATAKDVAAAIEAAIKPHGSTTPKP